MGILKEDAYYKATEKALDDVKKQRFSGRDASQHLFGYADKESRLAYMGWKVVSSPHAYEGDADNVEAFNPIYYSNDAACLSLIKANRESNVRKNFKRYTDGAEPHIRIKDEKWDYVAYSFALACTNNKALYKDINGLYQRKKDDHSLPSLKEDKNIPSYPLLPEEKELFMKSLVLYQIAQTDEKTRSLLKEIICRKYHRLENVIYVYQTRKEKNDDISIMLNQVIEAYLNSGSNLIIKRKIIELLVMVWFICEKEKCVSDDMREITYKILKIHCYIYTDKTRYFDKKRIRNLIKDIDSKSDSYNFLERKKNGILTGLDSLSSEIVFEFDDYFKNIELIQKYFSHLKQKDTEELICKYMEDICYYNTAIRNIFPKEEYNIFEEALDIYTERFSKGFYTMLEMKDAIDNWTPGPKRTNLLNDAPFDILDNLNSFFVFVLGKIKESNSSSSVFDNEKVDPEKEELKNKISELNQVILNEKQKNYRLEERISSFEKEKDTSINMEREIEKLKQKVSFLEKEMSYDKKELGSFRNQVYLSENASEIEPDAKETEAMAEVLNARVKGVVVGGHPSFTSKFQKMLPDWKMYSTDIVMPLEVIKRADVLVLCTDYISHSAYNRAVNAARTSTCAIHFINGRNISNSIKQIYDACNTDRDQK